MDSEDYKYHSLKLQNEIKNLGYVIDVIHTRPLLNFAAITPEGETDSCLSKKEFGDAVRTLSYKMDMPHIIEPKYGYFVEACGGFTVVILKKPNEIVNHRGKYNFGKSRNFQRSEGVFEALKKIINSPNGSDFDSIRHHLPVEESVTISSKSLKKFSILDFFRSPLKTLFG